MSELSNGLLLAYIGVMALVTYLIRLLPLVLFTQKINNVFVRSFLYYVPYVTLSVMTFPSIITATSSIYSGAAGFLAALVLAFCGAGLLKVAVGACGIVFLLELFFV